jgi:hypothetical protein
MREGIVAGVLGATMMAAWFLLVDWAEGVPLLTPSILGSLLTQGGVGSATDHPGLTQVAVYTVVHYLLFIAVGIGAAAVARRAEARPWILLGAILFVVAHTAFILSATTIFSEVLFGTLRWWTVVLGTVWAAAVMVAYLWSRHPGMGRITHEDEVFEPRS